MEALRSGLNRLAATELVCSQYSPSFMEPYMSLTSRIQLALELEAPPLTFVEEATGQELYQSLTTEHAVADAITKVFERMKVLPGYRLVRGEKAGAQRSVFIGATTVVKVPLVGDAHLEYLEDTTKYLKEHYHPTEVEFSPFDNMLSSLIEVAAYETDSLAHPTAPCRLLWHESGVPVVVMEKLILRTRIHGEVPDWSEEYECNQIGWSKMLSSWAGFDAGQAPDTTTLDERKWLAHMQRQKKRQLKRQERLLTAA